MIGLLGIGAALILGIGMRIAASTGTLLLGFMWAAEPGRMSATWRTPRCWRPSGSRSNGSRATCGVDPDYVAHDPHPGYGVRRRRSGGRSRP